ncbi:transposase [Pseudoduganella chitinolytica]|uniref:Transposase n=1 Tax=Pseudoduganella chitinolytica TaxID=34070 RepID=A0ABY8B4E5_9BURK|nr:transposase [Pseudoduganella chitinolytica]WEF30655.1 transposase [Pseudoduganella chitinolytica]
MTTKPEKTPVKDADAQPKHRSVYTKEFKLAAVARLKSGGQTAEALAIELGIRRNQLYKWAKAIEQNGPEANFGSRGRKPASEESELVLVKRELSRLKEDFEILKKLQASFTRLKR